MLSILLYCVEGPAEAAAPPEFLDSTEAGVPSLLGPDTQPMRPAKPGVYCRRAHTDEQAKAQLSMVSGGARYYPANISTLLLRDSVERDPTVVVTLL